MVSLVHQKDMEIPSQLRYQQYGHEHDLTLREISEHCQSIECRWCEERITGSAAYCCLNCSHFIHRECAELPAEIQHPFHPHHWLVRTNGDDRRCSICNFAGKICYSCEQCGFNLDTVCTMSTLHQEESHHEISHFLHEHQLKYYLVTGKNNHIKCKMCEIGMFGPDDNPLYGCLQCNFFLHESCSELPQEIKLDSFHQDPVTFLSSETNLACEICSEDCGKGSCYRCRKCGIGFHSRCAALVLSSMEGENSMEGLRHFSHEHPLSYFYAKSQTKIPCKICRKQIKGVFYGCNKCGFFIHKSCRELPQVMKHPVYPQQPLILTKHGLEEIKCSFCSDKTVTCFSYRCKTCPEIEDDGLKIDIDCANAILLPGLNKDGQSLEIKYFGHDHPMTFLDQCRGIKVRCNACNYRIEDGQSYYCQSGQCRMWLHKSCAEVPQVIMEHLLQPEPECPLTVIPNTSDHKCDVCYERIAGYVILCEETGFKMDFHCAFRRPILKHPRHEHRLSYFEKSISEWGDICDVCGKRIEFDLYFCAICKFMMHHSCLPLPQTVKSDRHDYELSLLEVYLEDHGEYYCDLCTEKRDHRQGVYYCYHCRLTCHIECIIPSKIGNKALRDLEKEIAGLEEKIDVEKDNVVAIEKNLDAAKKKLKNLETLYDALTRKRRSWNRKGEVL